MQRNKLFSLLKSLDADEMHWLGKFVRSPFYNSNIHLISLFDVVRKHHPTFSSVRLEKEKLFKKLFPDRPFNTHRMDTMMSRLAGLAEQFMVARRIQQDVFGYKKMLVAEFGERNLYKYFEKGTEKLLTELDEMPYRDETYYREIYETNLNFFGHPGTNNQIGNKVALEKAVVSFNNHKKLTDLKLECALNAIANTGGEKGNAFEKEGEAQKENPLFFLYEKLSLLQRTPEDEENMKVLSEKFMAHIHRFRVEDRNNILKILLNYCARFMNRGLTDFSKVGFELYKNGLENDCLIFNNKISEITFHNVVTCGTSCGEFEWTEFFIEEYKKRLDENIRKDAVTMSKGQWYYEKGDYGNVIETLGYTFKNPQDIFKSKSLLLRTWFELFIEDNSYFEMLMNNIDAFERYTRRNDKINERIKIAFLNFTIYARKIALAIMDKKEMDDLKLEISDNNNNIVLRNWLIKMIGCK